MAIMPGRFHGQERTMRRMLKPLVLLLACVGCTRYEGPLEVRKKDRADAPGYTIPEQRKRANERYSTINDDPRLYPSAGVGGYDPVSGR